MKNAAAPRALRYGKRESIIFPYYYDSEGKISNYTEEQFENDFPLAVIHLSKYREKLLKRDADHKAKWFEYGRSQALAHLNQNNLILMMDMRVFYKIIKYNLLILFLLIQDYLKIGLLQLVSLQVKNLSWCCKSFIHFAL